MRGGDLDRRIQFRRAAETDDGLGIVQTWGDHGLPVWASVLPVSDGERWRAGEVAAHITARFTVRWSQFAAGITPKDRLIYKDAEHDIFSVKEIGRREWIEITAAARAD